MPIIKGLENVMNSPSNYSFNVPSNNLTIELLEVKSVNAQTMTLSGVAIRTYAIYNDISILNAYTSNSTGNLSVPNVGDLVLMAICPTMKPFVITSATSLYTAFISDIFNGEQRFSNIFNAKIKQDNSGRTIVSGADGAIDVTGEGKITSGEYFKDISPYGSLQRYPVDVNGYRHFITSLKSNGAQVLTEVLDFSDICTISGDVVTVNDVNSSQILSTISDTQTTLANFTGILSTFISDIKNLHSYNKDDITTLINSLVSDTASYRGTATETTEMFLGNSLSGDGSVDDDTALRIISKNSNGDVLSDYKLLKNGNSRTINISNDIMETFSNSYYSERIGSNELLNFNISDGNHAVIEFDIFCQELYLSVISNSYHCRIIFNQFYGLDDYIVVEKTDLKNNSSNFDFHIEYDNGNLKVITSQIINDTVLWEIHGKYQTMFIQ